LKEVEEGGGKVSKEKGITTLWQKVLLYKYSDFKGLEQLFWLNSKKIMLSAIISSHKLRKFR
jgi:hypothetical protein